jgi:hypothetical protein
LAVFPVVIGTPFLLAENRYWKGYTTIQRRKPKIRLRVGNILKFNIMKKFVSENWYKLMIGSSLLMASFGFMVHSVSPAMADNSVEKMNANSNYKMVPTNADGSINVKLSDEQLNKIIPKNADGSINVKMSPNAVVDVNLVGIVGTAPAWLKTSSGNASLCISPPAGHGAGDGWGWRRD